MRNQLTLIKMLGKKNRNGNLLGLYLCSCGETKEIAITRVKNGYIKSCGCLRLSNPAVRTHGMTRSPTYLTWQAAKSRCRSPRARDYDQYGAAGITMCDKWADSFEEFLSDMGERPYGKTIDRIDGTLGYAPGNCRWATMNEQQRNRKGTFVWHIKGLTFETAEEAAVFFGVTKGTVCRWVLGHHDKRRGTTTKPRTDCHRESRYA